MQHLLKVFFWESTRLISNRHQYGNIHGTFGAGAKPQSPDSIHSNSDCNESEAHQLGSRQWHESPDKSLSSATRKPSQCGWDNAVTDKSREEFRQQREYSQVSGPSPSMRRPVSVKSVL